MSVCGRPCEGHHEEIIRICSGSHNALNNLHHTICINCTPPPSYHNINLPPDHPANLISERGAPPSYDEVIDPNGNYYFHK